MSTYEMTTEDCIAIPPRASTLGVDGDGAVHYIGNRVTSSGIPVFVEEADGSVDVFDLSETPCADRDDEVAAWIEHVAEKRGAWDVVTYDRSLVELLTDSVDDGQEDTDGSGA